MLDILQEKGIKIPDELIEVDVLTPYAVQTRYPGYWGEIATSDVTEAIAIAERAVEWAISEIGKPS